MPHILATARVDPAARARAAADWRAHRRREHDALVAEASALRDAAATDDERRAGYAVAIVPSNGDALAPLPRERRRAFRAHLARAVEDGWRRHVAGAPREAKPADPEPLPAAAALLGAACATCAGSCCRKGGDRAFLSADTLHRYFDAHPAARPRDALGAYLSRVGRDATVAGSCVYHERGGCALPREMRSDTCNRYFCGALAELRRAVSPLARPRAFVAAAEGGAIRAAAFVDADAVRAVPTGP